MSKKTAARRPEPEPEESRLGKPWATDDPISDIYADVVQISATFFSFIVEFGLSQRAGDRVPVARIRMSPEHAKDFALILLNGIREHELRTGYNIPVQPETMGRIDFNNLIIQLPEPGMVAPRPTTTEEETKP